MRACSHFWLVSIFWSKGIRKAAVFPVPVCDCPTIFFPSKVNLMTWAWISVALSYFISASALSSPALRLNDENNMRIEVMSNKNME